MRLLLKLKALKDFAYDEKYHYNIQGFIYRLTQGTPYEFLHSKKKYKFFCFSNIFPLKIGKNKKVCPFRRGDIKYLLISSPDAGFIKTIHKKLEEKIANNDEIKFGEMLFGLEGIDIVRTHIKTVPLKIKTETPITIRIPKERYKEYNIKSVYKYVFWRKGISLKAFVDLLGKNLFNKYVSFHQIGENKIINLQHKFFPFFQVLDIGKSVSFPLIINGKEQVCIGVLVRFIFKEKLNLIQRKILKFAVDAGFGERNSYGFGFVNISKN